MTTQQKAEHDIMLHRASLSTRPEHKAMWLRKAKAVREDKLVVIRTMSCEWFSNTLKEIKR